MRKSKHKNVIVLKCTKEDEKNANKGKYIKKK